ncbi:hypothetical protein KHA90_07660 [Flavobacterium psychroterrae]|uniref:Uncharacterized protein n=1 Tax=Flavobacterium psychroterrae TaxID=2133767 RepID=A0ABS5P9A8_9FLAO|nr:hypothetical protein [Flavobacterium psychroterrae]MBS7230898.1 hypothetical protein [Flavobacterium psychroterrae]
MINSNELNDYSNKVYEYLKKNNSKLLENISLQPSDFGKNHIFIELRSKNKNSSSNLYFSSENNELTVGFDGYHCHFDSYSDQDFKEEIKIALDYFYKILSEELFVVCAGGGTTTLLTNQEIDIIESGQTLEKFDYDCITYYITSLSGDHDRIIKNTN